MVGGRRHSQGGTIIEAEQGEFVMSRDAVSRIGVNNLEAMNSGGGGMTINVQGSVIGTEEFVESVLLDQIKEGLRLGGDIGV